MGGDNIHDGALKLNALMVAQVGRGTGLTDKFGDDQFDLSVKPDLSTKQGKKLGNRSMNSIDRPPELAHEGVVRVRMEGRVTKFCATVALLVVFTSGTSRVKRETKAVEDCYAKISVNQGKGLKRGEITKTGTIAGAGAGKKSDARTVVGGSLVQVEKANLLQCKYGLAGWHGCQQAG